MTEPLRLQQHDPRLRRLNDRPVAPRGDYVLYWMQAFRRAEDNAALDFAVATANELGVPCLVYDALRPDDPHSSDRLHTFALEGARDVATGLARRGIAHAFFLPRTGDAAEGALATLAARARMVVSDDFPSHVVPDRNAAAAARGPCAYVVVDDCAVVPMSLLSRPEHAARTLRPKIAAALDTWLRPLERVEPRLAPRRLDLPFDSEDLARADLQQLVASCTIDHEVWPVGDAPGGTTAAEARLEAFTRDALASYDVDRNDPSRRSTSELSAYLRFGMISARRVALAAREWGRGAALDAFLEQLLVRRGLAFHFARARDDHASWTALPDWARATLEQHRDSGRVADLSRDGLERALSPDPLWNAAMRELRARGTITPYARMLWGKLPLGWMRSPEEAHAALVALNDRWALDGRDPSGYANVSWCFGLHDRPWPSRPVFGTVRCMTSASARRKLDFEGYIDRWSREG
jgi:deoxyribodipyrimidine photo-lyase